MNQADLIAHVAGTTGLSKADAGKAVEVVFGAVSSELAAGKEVRLNGFGVFSTTERAAREGRNPQTGAAPNRRLEGGQVFSLEGAQRSPQHVVVAGPRGASQR